MHYVLRRLLQALPVLFGASLITFFLLNALPGDPARAVLGEEATPEALATLRDQLGLDEPLPLRYLHWVGGALTGDLGVSFRTGEQVVDIILSRVPVSLEIVVLAQVLAVVVAVPVATMAAYRRDSIFDRFVQVVSFGGVAAPNFLLALVFILVFSVNLQLLPATGFRPLSDGLGANLRTVALPALTLAVHLTALYARLLRNEMLETMSEDYIATAVAKGLAVRRVLSMHVLRNSLFALLTIAGISFGTLLGGAVITETIFAVPGIGREVINAIYQRDVNVVQGLVLFISVSYVLVNLLVDLLYAVLDPRIRHGRSTA